MKNDWWFKFEYSKWDDPNLKLCSMEAQGFWLRIYLALRKSNKSSITATVEELARVVGCSADEAARSVDQIKKFDVANVVVCNAENVTSVTRNTNVTLESRSLKSELSTREQTRLRVQRYRRNDGVTPEKQDRVLIEEEVEKKKEEKKGTNVPSSADAKAVFEYWQTKANKPNHTFTVERKKRILTRLQTFTVDQLRQAIDAAVADPFHRGDNERHTEYLDIPTIFKNDAKVENFLFNKKTPTVKVNVTQMNDFTNFQLPEVRRSEKAWEDFDN